jgi:hypothetical protein
VGRPVGTGGKHRPGGRKTYSLEMEQKCVDLYLRQKMPMEQIAPLVGLNTRKGVWHHITKAKKRWLADINRDVSEHKAEVKAKLDIVFVELMAAWEKSKTSKAITTAKVRGPANAAGTGMAPQQMEKQSTSTEQTGNPAYMALILQCLEKIIKLFGLEAPAKVETTGADGGPISLAVKMDDVTLNERIDLLLRRTKMPPVMQAHLRAMKAPAPHAAVIDVDGTVEEDYGAHDGDPRDAW